MIVVTAVCCYLFWLLVFLHQLNPLIKPELSRKTIMWIDGLKRANRSKARK